MHPIRKIYLFIHETMFIFKYCMSFEVIRILSHILLKTAQVHVYICMYGNPYSAFPACCCC